MRFARRLQDSYGEIWKVSNAALAYPNAELVRKALVAILPPACIVLLPHSHFGIDLGPGLSVKMKSASVSDVVAIKAWRETASRSFARNSADR